MDPNQKVFDPTVKKELEKSLVEKIISALESKQIDLVQMKTISNYILDNINNIDDYNKLNFFLDDLQNKWSIFTDLKNLYKNKFYQDKEKAVINKLSNYISGLSN